MVRRAGADRNPIGVLAVFVLLLGIGAAALIFVIARANVRDTERSLLRERTTQTLGVIATVTHQLEAIVASGAAAAAYTGGDARAFDETIGDRARTSLLSSFSLLRLGPGGATLVTSVGRSPPLLLGKLRAEARERLRAIARSGSGLTAVVVARHAGAPIVGFAASPRPGSDLVLYGETTAADAQAQAGGAPSDLSFAIYLGEHATPDALLLSSPGGGPTGEDVVTDVVRIGEEQLLVTLGPRRSLVSGFTRYAPWLMLGIGLIGSLALAALVEMGRRRRDEALRLVSEQERAEQDARSSAKKLAEAEETYRTLVERLPLVTYIDRLGDIVSSVYVSPQIEELLGYSVEEWLADSELFVKLLHPDDRERVLADAARWKAGEGEPGPAIEYRLIARDGQVVWVYGDSVQVRDAEGRSVYSQGFLIDITGRKRLEEELRQTQRMEAVGRLAGGVAHDFNNVLAVIIGFANLLLRDLAADDPQREKAEQIARAGERAATLTRQLLAFSRRQLLQPEILDLNHVVLEMKRLLERLIGEDIRLLTMLDPSLGSVRADRAQLEQVILNLAVNARDAMPGGGRIVIETRNVEFGEPDGDELPDWSAGPYVMLEVSDTGHGMDETTRAHAFEPFFTTKESGKGTGLGLATVYGIITQSGGSISVTSKPGEGARFTIYLPRVDERVPVVDQPQDSDEDALRGSEVILLVEDDRAVRDMVRRVLADHGYEVVAAESARAGIEVSARRHGEIDLLLTDVVLPGLSGRQLSEALTATHARMRTLYMSGYTDDAIVHHGVLDEGIAFISKPFAPSALLRKVREVLGVHEPGVVAHGWQLGR